MAVYKQFYDNPSGSNYVFGFNGMESDGDLKGEKLDYTTEFRQYDPRVGRWFSPDPVVKPWESPYVGFANNPIYYSDPSGLDPADPHGKNDTRVSRPTTRDPDGHYWVHTVQDNESPSSIAQAESNAGNSITLDQLAAWNTKIFKGYDAQNPDPHYWDASNKSNYMLHTGDQLAVTAPPPVDNSYSWSMGVPTGSIKDPTSAVNTNPSVFGSKQEWEFAYDNWYSGYIGNTSEMNTFTGRENPYCDKGLVVDNTFVWVWFGIGQALAESGSLLAAGNTLEENNIYTAAGRSLQKHASRPGSIYPKVFGNPGAINSQGEAVLKSIIENPNAESVIRYHAIFGEILEIKIPGGMGARFTSDGKTFLGFLDPGPG